MGTEIDREDEVGTEIDREDEVGTEQVSEIPQRGHGRPFETF